MNQSAESYSIGRLRGGLCLVWRDPAISSGRRRYRLRAAKREEAEVEARDLFLSLTGEPQPMPDVYDRETGLVRIDVLRQLIDLDPATGILIWRERGLEWFRGNAQAQRVWNARYAGREALSHLNQQGYKEGCLFGIPIAAHRVAFALHNGKWPDGPTDHADGVRSNNRPGNLREATHQENSRNRGSAGGSSRFCGVSWNKQAGRWAAYCTDDTARLRHLGYFNDEESAARAYDVAASRWHGGFARLNFPEPADPA